MKLSICRLATLMLWAALLLSPLAKADTAEDEIHALLDGLHRDAAQANFESYFHRYTADSIFLGTDKTERWSISDFKDYARPHFQAGRGWTYQPRERFIMGNGELRGFDEVLWSENYGHCRGTGVVIKTDDGWRVAHYSLTFLIPNEVAADATALGIAAEAEAEADMSQP